MLTWVTGKERSHKVLNLVSGEGVKQQPFCFSPEIRTQWVQVQFIEEKSVFWILMHVQTIFQNALDWPMWNYQHASNFVATGSSIFEEKYCHSIHFISAFLIRVHPEHSALWTGVTPLLNLEKSIKNLCSSQCLLAESCFQLQTFPQHYLPSFEQTLIQTCHPSGSANF
jgi:hypothetical protein